jgi:hypothetical protein
MTYMRIDLGSGGLTLVSEYTHRKSSCRSRGFSKVICGDILTI